MASTGERLRGPVVAGAAFAATLAAAAALRTYEPLDWATAQRAGGLLLDGQLDLYARLPEAQMGPLALALAGVLPRPAYVVTVCALIAVVAGLTTPRHFATLAVALALLAVPWSLYALEGHADDAIVATAGLMLARATLRRRPAASVGWFVVAIAAKPTAIVLLPLVLHAGGWGWALGAAAAGAAVWAPFVLADVSGFLSAGGGIAAVWPGSLPHLLGEPTRGPFPGWVRPVQLAGGLALCWIVGRRDPYAAMVAVFAFRALLEPNAMPSYMTLALAAAVIADARSGVGPLLSVLAFSGWVASYLYPLNSAEALLRVALLTLVVVVALRGGVMGSDASSGERRPVDGGLIDAPVEPGVVRAARDAAP